MAIVLLVLRWKKKCFGFSFCFGVAFSSKSGILLKRRDFDAWELDLSKKIFILGHFRVLEASV